MSKRFIGIDISDGTLHLAIASSDKGGTMLDQVSSHPLGDLKDLPGLLVELLGPSAGFGDRLLQALPARCGYLRWLEFPFREERKVAAALELELAGELPVGTDDLLITHAPLASGEGKGARVVAAAVPVATVGSTLASYDEESWPLHIVDYLPLALAGGLGTTAARELLVYCGPEETTVCRLENGYVMSLSLLPAQAEQPPEEVVSFVSRQVTSLLGGDRETRIWLVAPRFVDQLHRQLADRGLNLSRPAPACRTQPPDNSQLPAALLALRAARQEKQKGVNFRQGEFALRGEWQKLRRSLGALVVLLLLLLGSAGTTVWLKYESKAKQAEQLRQQMVAIYQELFPGEPPPRDVQMLLQAKLVELRQRSGSFGLDRKGSPLILLKEISQLLPKELNIDIRDLNYTPEGIRLAGFTGSFDSVNQAARTLQNSPLFADAKIADAKMSIDNTRVDFQLSLSLAKEGGQ